MHILFKVSVSYVRRVNQVVRVLLAVLFNDGRECTIQDGEVLRDGASRKCYFRQQLTEALNYC